ncbi:hypothetical protein XELAEV_18033928mg [Xenopus laevis]|uniref:Uncharacterized protein n=1 Tax=Xenopus laevis TaxID=8355 RepID=A0A974CLH9_XENLA|nr:hypothetical protein XELAEV_18033928mg [Xenopus laevis]
MLGILNTGALDSFHIEYCKNPPKKLIFRGLLRPLYCMCTFVSYPVSGPRTSNKQTSSIDVFGCQFAA